MLLRSGDVLQLTGLTRSQLREWSSPDRRNLISADVLPRGPGRHALFSWQTVLALRILNGLHQDFAVEVSAWAPVVAQLGRDLQGVPFPSLWGVHAHFVDRLNYYLFECVPSAAFGGIIVPLDPHLSILAGRLALPPPNQLSLFPVMAVTR